MRRKMVTREMDLCSFSQGCPSEKLHISIPRVSIFLLIDMPWWILCPPGHKTITYTTHQLICTNPRHGKPKDSSCTSLTHADTQFFHVNLKEICYLPELWSLWGSSSRQPPIATLFAAKNNKSYSKLMIFSEFNLWRKSLSVTVEHVFVIYDMCTKHYLQWGSWET